MEDGLINCKINLVQLRAQTPGDKDPTVHGLHMKINTFTCEATTKRAQLTHSK